MSESLKQPQPPNLQQNRRFSPGNLLLWLLLVPGVFGVLFFFSQLALVLNLEDLATNTRSMLLAQYMPWSYVEIPPINIEALISDIQRDVQLFGTPEPEPTFEIGEFLRPPTAEATKPPAPTQNPPTLLPTLTPTTLVDTLIPATQTLTRTVAPTTTQQPSRTSTPTPTATNTTKPIILTYTQTSPPEEKPPTKVPTNTPVTPSPIPTKVVTDTDTPAPPPATDTPTLPPTLELAPVRPIAENNGLSSVDPEGQGCLAYFGYRNENPVEIDIPIGERNNLSETPVRIGPESEQPTHFYTDRVSPAFEVVWNSGNSFIWTLDGRQAIALWCNP